MSETKTLPTSRRKERVNNSLLPPSGDPFNRRSTRRNNYPGLDDAFNLPSKKIVHADTTPKMGTSKGRKSIHSMQASPLSDCSLNASNASVDMSIGARAAMTEHLRHIARYGLDGQSPEDSTVKGAVEDEWERVMDENHSYVSWTTVDDSALQNFTVPLVGTNASGNECVEVIADMSSDFFNSSRVHQLMTPEKNKKFSPRVTSRGDVSFGVETSTSDSQVSDHTEESGVMDLFRTALRFNEPPDTNSSFVSLTAVDVSRISGLDQSPDNSFEISRSRTSPKEVGDVFPSIDEAPSFDRTPVRRQSPQKPMFSPTQPSFISPGRSPSRSRIVGTSDKENIPNFMLALSPIAARAGSTAEKLLKSLPLHSTSDPFPDSFSSPNNEISTPSRLTRTEEQHGTPQSGFIKRTLSHSNLSAIDFQNCSGIAHDVSVNLDLSIIDKEPLSTPNRSNIGMFNTNKQNHESGSGSTDYKESSSSGYKGCSSSSGLGSKNSPQTFEDDVHNYRRKYRSVVPTRVFMSEDEAFPTRDDSFSAPSGCSSSSNIMENTKSPRKSLVTSFDDAFDEAIGKCD